MKMKKKKYPTFEDSDTGMAKEPVSALEYQREVVDIDNFEVDVPIAGPATFEEALSDIEQSEKDCAEGRIFSWEEVKQTIDDRIASYAN